MPPRPNNAVVAGDGGGVGVAVVAKFCGPGIAVVAGDGGSVAVAVGAAIAVASEGNTVVAGDGGGVAAPEHGKDLAHGNSVVFSDSPIRSRNVDPSQRRAPAGPPTETSPDARSRNVLPTRFWSRMLGAPGKRRPNASSKPSASI
jgi:hypothetical protein